MIAASALLLLAEAMIPCTTAGTPRLGGGAVMERPVGGFEAVPFKPLGPATSVPKKPGIRQTGASGQQGQGEDNSSDHQCQAPISIA